MSRENIEYPQLAKEAVVEGKVIVSFVIQASGYVAHVKIVKGTGAGCDEEAIRVVKLLPQWSPGYQKGIPVTVEYKLPINFALH